MSGLNLHSIHQNVKNFLYQSAIPLGGVGDVHYVCKAGEETEDYWADKVQAGFIHPTISDAHTNTMTDQNDVVLLDPNSHTQGSALTWSRNRTHLIGMAPEAMMNQRSRIGHNANFSPLLTVSGEGNLFQNLYFMHGRGNATNLILMRVTGNRNSFINCHFGSPMNATEADESNFNPIDIQCGEVYFKKCTFGVETIAWTDGDMIRFYGPSDRSVRAVFEDCLFIMNADNAQVNFITTTSGQGRGFAYFKNCFFINEGTTMTLAIDGAGTGNFKIFCDANTGFYGATDVIAAANEANVVFISPPYTSAATANGLTATADHTA